MPPFSPGKRLLVVGAGATFGAEFKQRLGCRPPLNATFFTELQRITEAKYTKLIGDVMRDVVELVGPNFSLTLEDYFTQLEFLAEAVQLAPKGSGAITGADVNARRQRLTHALAAVLEVSTDQAIRKEPGCERHAALVGALDPTDTVISFNYDCVLDHALRTHGNGKWSAKYGYAIPKPSRIAGSEHWDPTVPADSKTTVHLLKLHGSLNWQFPSDPDGEVKFKQRLHQQHGVPRFTVIPPVWNKNVGSRAIFKDLWTNAERAIRKAEQIVVVGFSFTPTDLPVQSLFRVALARKTPLKSLVIVNPSRDDRARIRAVFSRPLEKRVVVRQYDHLAEFTDALPRALTT